MPVKNKIVKSGENAASVSVPKKTSRKKHHDYSAEIMEKAFSLYLQRVQNGSAGTDVDDWLIAEKEIKKIHNL